MFEKFRFLTSGESHGKCLTAIIEGLPSGLNIDVEFINSDKTLILAKVPVYGMVNYRGNLVRIKYI